MKQKIPASRDVKPKGYRHGTRKKMNITVPLERTLYAEYTNEHFKFYCPLMKQELFINIYAKKQDTPVVFNALMEKYVAEGMQQIDAAKKARDVVHDFFTICVELSKKKVWPFKIRFTKIDVDKIKHKTD